MLRRTVWKRILWLAVCMWMDDCSGIENCLRFVDAFFRLLLSRVGRGQDAMGRTVSIRTKMGDGKVSDSRLFKCRIADRHKCVSDSPTTFEHFS